MKEKLGPQLNKRPTIGRQERHQGTRRMPLIDLSATRERPREVKRALRNGFPTVDSSVEQVRDYILGRSHPNGSSETPIPDTTQLPSSDQSTY